MAESPPKISATGKEFADDDDDDDAQSEACEVLTSSKLHNIQCEGELESFNQMWSWMYLLHQKLHIDIQIWAWILRDSSSRSKKIFYFVFILFVIQAKENKDLQIN